MIPDVPFSRGHVAILRCIKCSGTGEGHTLNPRVPLATCSMCKGHGYLLYPIGGRLSDCIDPSRTWSSVREIAEYSATEYTDKARSPIVEKTPLTQNKNCNTRNNMNNRIEKGDRVRVTFAEGGYFDAFEGVVNYTPCATGDSWAIVQDDSTVVYVQQFETMILLGKPNAEHRPRAVARRGECSCSTGVDA